MCRELKDSGIPWIREIPKDWEVVRNKNVFDNSKTLVGELWNSTQLLSLTTKGIKAVSIGSTSGKVPDSYETYQVVEKDNLVMCLFDLDCSAVFSGLSPFQGMISPAYKVLTIKDGYFPAFYDKWFNYIFDGRKFMFLSKNIRYSLTYDEFASLQIVKPSLAEQQRIAEFLDRKCAEVDEMIGLQEQIIEELKAYKQSVITEAVTKGLNPAAPMRDSGIDWIGQIPEHWEVKRLKYLCSIQTGNKDTQDADKDGAYPFYVRSPFVERSTTYSFEGEGILMAGDGAGAGRVFHHAFGKYAVHQRVYRLSDIKHINSNYLFYYISNLFNKVMDMGSAQSTVPSVRLPMLTNFRVCCPNIEEQQAIADYLDEKCADIDSLIQTKQSKIDSLKEYKKSIIYEYVTGKREVE